MPDASKYTVGWICAIKPEYVAAQSFLDEKHDRPDHVSTNDTNIYTLGRFGKHNVVIGVMPDGEYGIATAGGVAKGMLTTFSNIRIGLMVGIGGGAPSSKNDIRLGDIVVSAPRDGHGGVFQYDFGKTIQGQIFQKSGFLNQPPELLRAAIADIQAEYEMDGHQLEESINGVFDRKPRLRRNYRRPGEGSDKLFQSTVVHCGTGASCTTDCYDGPSSLVKRRERNDEEDNPAIHYGTIASANQLMKDALVRDKLAAEKNVLCFEMEAAGLMNRFPCIVIRGICDYSDTHKTKEWQGYAAMAAAAYAKDLLYRIPPNKIEAERQISTVLESLIALKSNHHLADLERWLSPPDYSSNLKAARGRRHHDTGTWLLDSPAYMTWKLGSRQHLWLYGLAGCGKTVLSTRIIDNLVQTETHTTVFFFFDFNDPGKQTLESLLRSLVFQLYHLGGEAVSGLDRLFTSHDNGRKQLGISALSDYIKLRTQTNKKVVIVVDALDECTTRKELIYWLRDFSCCDAQLLITSRPESEFQCEIPRIFDKENCILLDKKAMNHDICSYVTARLERDPDFTSKNLSQDLQQKIYNKVGDGADGMFRWATCQLDSLAKCLCPYDIETALGSLPSDLGKTYRRMLQNIPVEYQSSAIRLLQFLVYAKRPLTVSEAVEVIATEIDREPRGFQRKRRLFKETDILKYCPSLVLIAQVTTRTKTIKELHLAHFSVKEYLLKETQFSLENASMIITRTCLNYLSDIKGDYDKMKMNFPMAKYAAEFWISYAASAEPSQEITRRVVRFLQDETTFQQWGQLHQADRIWDKNMGPPTASRLYYVCLGGLAGVARSFVDKGADVNAQGGIYGNALQAASNKGHQEIVQLLLGRGANVNAQGGTYGNALQAASGGGHRGIAQLLLDNGANVNARDSTYGNALYIASNKGYQEIVQLLLDKGADVNAQGGTYGNALQAASNKGHQEIVQLLLDKGAHFNAQGGTYSNALQAASEGGHRGIVQLLLDNGADVNAHGGLYGNALHAALHRGHQDVIQLLLDNGADLNAQGSTYSNALQAASQGGHRGIVQLLLDNGANVNAQGGTYGNALYIASAAGHQEIIQLLLDNGADVNLQSGKYSNALQAAAERGHRGIVQLLLDNRANINAQGSDALRAASNNGHQEIVQLLLDNGADVNLHSGKFNNALQAASERGHRGIVQLLLSNGADVNIQGGTYGNALYIALAAGHQEIVQLLLDNGADVNSQSGKYNNALQAASETGHRGIVQLLLDNGADANIQGGIYGNALYIALAAGHQEIVQLLLDNGADVNSQSGKYSNVLQAASETGHRGIVQMLLDNGANINTRDNTYGNALYIASNKGYREIVQLLLDKGADVNAQGGTYGNALQAASNKGHQEIVQLLLGRGANVNAQGGTYGNALQAASETGHRGIVQMLLDNGANINTRDNTYDNALYIASNKGYREIVQLLLDKGADVNAQGGTYGNALQAASQGGHRGIVQLLLDNGANVSAQGGIYGNALQAASNNGHQELVRLLLDNGADVNSQSGKYSNALQAASERGHQEIVQLLLGEGANVNAQGGVYKNAFQAASERGHRGIVQLLLDNGADINAQGSDALRAASNNGHQEIVQLLLGKGVNVNVQGGIYGNALQAASEGGHRGIVQLLLDKGADVNAQGGAYGNALQVASKGGYHEIVQLLLDNGADVSAQGGIYGNALQAASEGGYQEIVQLLMRSGAKSRKRPNLTSPKEELAKKRRLPGGVDID